jgi:phosphonopyruvate decarboxylase
MNEQRLPYALIVPKDALGGGISATTATSAPASGTTVDLLEGVAPPTRLAALERFLSLVPAAAAVIATTGKCGRELFALADRPQHLYQVGSMGGASAMALGVALNTRRPVVVLDGDGAALMKLGNLATIGNRAPANLVHVVLDNRTHDSTGGQPTASTNVDFAAVAVACGYPSAYRVDGLAGFARALAAAFANPGPTLIHCLIAPGSSPMLGRPTVRPDAVARRFKDFLAGAR